MPSVTSFAKEVTATFVENHLVPDPLQAFWVRSYKHRCFVGAALQVFPFWSFHGNFASWLGDCWLGPVRREQCFTLFGFCASSLRPADRSVVDGIDEVRTALVPYKPTLALEM